MSVELASTTSRTIEWHTECNRYLGKRTGTYAFRCRRYDAVLQEMLRLGFAQTDIVADIGAGRCEFGLYLREKFPWSQHVYLPVDGAIDGVDLETWEPQLEADFYVAIELLEHLRDPWRLFEAMKAKARKGVILTTPNPATTDVLGMDETHKTPLHLGDLFSQGCESVKLLRLFTAEKDTLVGTWRNDTSTRCALALDNDGHSRTGDGAPVFARAASTGAG